MKKLLHKIRQRRLDKEREALYCTHQFFWNAKMGYWQCTYPRCKLIRSVDSVYWEDHDSDYE